MTKVLVTGANGFVGLPLCRWLGEQGYQVVAGVRSEDKLGAVPAGGVVVGDIDGQTDWQLEGVDSIVHLAARVHVMSDRAADPLAEFRKINIAGTERLARQAAAAGVQRLIYLSSIKVNGESTPEAAAFTEADPPAPVDPYGVSKQEAEQTLQSISRETGLEVVIIRPPLIYGPRVKGNFITLLNWMYRGIPVPVALARNKRSMIYVDNLTHLIETCLHHPAAAGKIFLASDGADVSTPELLRRLSSALGQQAYLLPVPETILRALLRPLQRENMVDRLFGSLVVKDDYTRQRLDWMPPYSLEAGLARTAQWYLRER